MIWLSHKIQFPDYAYTTKEGIIALGGDLSIERLIFAYENGIFPWFSEDEPIVWYCPLKRMVLYPKDLKVSKSMQKLIKNCKTVDRNDGLGTWITNDMQEAYINLHKKGIAKSIEVWQDNNLVGGLYGLEINGIFCGESMFAKVSNASKFAFIRLVKNKNYKLIDCQVYNPHLASLGAKEIDREVFLKILKSKN